MLLKETFQFQAAYPRRSLRATQRATDRLLCLGTKYSLAPDPASVAVTTDVSLVVTKTPGVLPAGRVNVVLAHANGFVKELYEPFITSMMLQNRNIQAVFIHDVVSQGASGRLNATLLGDEYPWSDSGNDILGMINYLRTQKIMDDSPIVGVGHSMGGCQVAYASIIHPRMFAALILIDPIIAARSGHMLGGFKVASLSARRRDVWPSRANARSKFLKSPFYQSWNSEVFEKWIEYGLIPTGNGSEVTLATTAAQEVYSFLHYVPYEHEEFDPDCGTYVFKNLPTILIPTHFLFGETSSTISPELRSTLTSRARQGTRLDVAGCGHLIPMEAPNLTATYCADYANRALQRWHDLERADRLRPKSLTLTREYKQMISDMISTGGNVAKGPSKL